MKYFILLFIPFNCFAYITNYSKFNENKKPEMLRSEAHPEMENEIKFPIYAEVDGEISDFDLNGGRDDVQEGIGKNEACFGGVNEKIVCIKNQIIQIKAKKDCLAYIYDDVIMYIETRYANPIYKGHLIGYASSEANAKPKILKIC